MTVDTCISCGEQIPEGRQVCPGCEKRQWIKITVPGRPVPKGRPRLGVRGKKVYIYTPTETKEYEKLVGWTAKAQGCRPTDKPVIASLDIYTRRKMDLDNVAKSILDGLNGVVYKDDDQVVELLVRKFQVKQTEERVEIKILKTDQKCWRKGYY